jgi:glycosyltransferase involved in cell wall biosynthesis
MESITLPKNTHYHSCTSTQSKVPVSVILLTYNEEKNLPLTLQHLLEWVDEIFVVDSFSTDDTLQIAKNYGVAVFQNRFETHTKQWLFALSHLPIRNKWILGLDADQQITTQLAQEIRLLFMHGNPSHDGYYIKRRMFFLGKWIKHGGYYPRYLLKLFRRDKVFLDAGELMDHHFYVKGTTGQLKHDLIEDNKNETLQFWLTKHIRYATLQAQEELSDTRKLKTINASIFGNQDARRQLLKNIWEKLPLFLRPFMYFIYRYFFQMGFLDGYPGFIFHFLQAFWYRFTVDSLIFESNSKKPSLTSEVVTNIGFNETVSQINHTS